VSSFIFKQRIIKIGFLFIFYCLITMNIFTEKISEEFDARDNTKEALDYITGYNFEDADRIILLLESENKNIIYSSFLKQYKFYWRFLLSPYDEAATKQFISQIEKTIEACNRKEYENNQDAELFKVMSYIFKAVVKDYNEKFISSLFWLNKARIEIEKLDVNKGDVGFLKGCRDYYSLKKDIDTTIVNLQKASSDGYYFNDIALIMIADIFRTKTEELNNSLTIYRELINSYPQNSLLSYYLAKNLQHSGKNIESIDVFSKTLDTINYHPIPNELICNIHFSLGQIYETELEDYHSAAAEYQTTLRFASHDIEELQWFIPYSLLHTGIAYYKMGAPDRALNNLYQVKKADNIEAYKKAQDIIKGIVDRDAK